METAKEFFFINIEITLKNCFFVKNLNCKAYFIKIGCFKSHCGKIRISKRNLLHVILKPKDLDVTHKRQFIKCQLLGVF